jgi:hypothetical protein
LAKHFICHKKHPGEIDSVFHWASKIHNQEPKAKNNLQHYPEVPGLFAAPGYY